MQPGVLPGDSGVPAKTVSPSYVPLAESAEVREEVDEKEHSDRGRNQEVADTRDSSSKKFSALPIFDGVDEDGPAPSAILDKKKERR